MLFGKRQFGPNLFGPRLLGNWQVAEVGNFLIFVAGYSVTGKSAQIHVFSVPGYSVSGKSVTFLFVVGYSVTGNEALSIYNTINLYVIINVIARKNSRKCSESLAQLRGMVFRKITLNSWLRPIQFTVPG